VDCPCHCGGNLVYITDMVELEDLKKNCSVCGYLNSFHAQRCDKCGRCFDIRIEYLESPLNDIEITSDLLRIYNKVDGKLADFYDYNFSKIRDFSILKEKSMRKLKFNYDNNDVISEITYEQAAKLEELFEISHEIFICPNLKCNFDKLLDEGEKYPDCGVESMRATPEKYNKLLHQKKQISDKLMKNKRIKATEQEKKYV
jgi:hypothetical protein